MTEAGPTVDRLDLQTFTTLRRLTLAQYLIIDDGALPPLTSLTLRYCDGVTEQWFQPQLFQSLRTLSIAQLRPDSLRAIASSARVREQPVGLQAGVWADFLSIFERCIPESTFSSALTSLSLDLYGLWNFQEPQAFSPLLTFLEAISSLKSLRTLEILSTPDDEATPGGHTLFASLALYFPLLTSLLVFLGDGFDILPWIASVVSTAIGPARPFLCTHSLI